MVRRKLEKYFSTKKFASLPMGFTMVVRRNVFCSFSGTWKFVLLIWWYAAEKRLGTPELDDYTSLGFIFKGRFIFLLSEFSSFLCLSLSACL